MQQVRVFPESRCPLRDASVTDTRVRRLIDAVNVILMGAPPLLCVLVTTLPREQKSYQSAGSTSGLESS
jgi:hypothetical protein